TSTAIYPCCAPASFTITQTMKTSWLWTARPRVGYKHQNTLFYLTGGVAVTRLTYQALFTDTFASAHENGGGTKPVIGWTGGGGIDYKWGGNRSVKREYLYSDFHRSAVTSSNLTTSGGAVAYPQNTFTRTIFLIQHDLRFGFNYHF